MRNIAPILVLLFARYLRARRVNGATVHCGRAPLRTVPWLKVSDEFTVPLCATHHSENHATGDERRWWQEHNIDPPDKVALAAWKRGPPIQQLPCVRLS